MFGLAIIATIALVVVASSAVVACGFAFLAMRSVLRTEIERRDMMAASMENLLSQEQAIKALSEHLKQKEEDDVFSLDERTH
jgi:hypothetical protein